MELFYNSSVWKGGEKMNFLTRLFLVVAIFQIAAMAVLIFQEIKSKLPNKTVKTDAERKQSDTMKLTAIAMLSALAFVVMLWRVPLVPAAPFLKFDAKDIIILIGAFILDPFSGVMISVIVSLTEMVTVSESGWIGAVMNIISSCAFIFPAAVIYHRRRNIKWAAVGLVIGVLLMTTVMLMWNYFLVPIYTGWPRDRVADMLVPVFLPFNLLKGTINSAAMLLIYKPVFTTLKRTRLMPLPAEGKVKSRDIKGILLLAGFVLLTGAVYMMVVQGRM